VVIARVWEELLGLERVGRHDHFFELGGHSLLVVQVLVRIREQFDVDISLRDLFERPLLSSLADIVVSAQLNLFSHSDVANMEKDLYTLSESDLRAMLLEGVAINQSDN
jgi:acyl carrier protein